METSSSSLAVMESRPRTKEHGDIVIFAGSEGVETKEHGDIVVIAGSEGVEAKDQGLNCQGPRTARSVPEDPRGQVHVLEESITDISEAI